MRVNVKTLLESRKIEKIELIYSSGKLTHDSFLIKRFQILIQVLVLFIILGRRERYSGSLADSLLI